MHILYVIDSLVPGGAERSLAALAPYYIQHGITLDVAYLKDRPGLQVELEAAGARLFCLAGPGGRVGWTRRAVRLARELQPDVIHTTLADANQVGRIAGALSTTPVVCSLVNVQYGPEHASDPNVLPWRMQLLRFYDAITSRKVRRFHAVTREVADVMARRLLIPRERIDVIARGRDPLVLGRRTRARRSRARALLGVGSKTKVVLAVARHEHQKRLDLLIEALPGVLERVPDTRLVIAGREGNATELLRQAALRFDLNGQVRSLGERDDVADLLCASDVLVLPSRREGFPGVLLEAMALETPIVATDLPGVREVVGDTGVARLVHEGQAGDLAAEIVDALTNDLANERRIARGRRRFEELFTTERVAARMIAFYHRALGPSERLLGGFR